MLHILPAPFVCTLPYFSSEQWDHKNSNVQLRRGEEKGRSYRKAAIFCGMAAATEILVGLGLELGLGLGLGLGLITQSGGWSSPMA